MCWACFEGEHQTASYRVCDGCGKPLPLEELQEYDAHREWGHLIEFIEHKKRIMLFCANCRDAMNAYRESTRALAAETEPYVWHHYYNRGKDTKPDAIPVAIKAEHKTLGLKCAREIYGDEAIEEILQGFVYNDDNRLSRLTIADTDETICCERCWRRLWVCNSMEVTR